MSFIQEASRFVSHRPVVSSDGVSVARRDRRLKNLIRHAYDNCPRYRRSFQAAGIDPRNIVTAADLSALPLLRPDELRESPKEFHVENIALRRCVMRQTNGTSGRPLVIPTTRMENTYEAFLWARGYIACGMNPWEPHAKFVLGERVRGRDQHFFQRLGWLQRKYISISTLPSEKVDELLALRPQALVTWASLLYEVCSELERRSESLRIPLIITTSDMLWPQLRERAQHALGARIVDVYGSVEAGPIAWECSHGAYHVQEDETIVEILDDQDQPCDSGRVVITVLWRHAMPIVRYALGDMAEWSKDLCPCGNTSPTLRALSGRVQDVVRLTDGQEITTSTLKGPMMGMPSIRQYQLAQTASNRLIFRLVPGPDFPVDGEVMLKKRFEDAFGDIMGLDVVRVHRIQVPEAQKFSTLITREQIDHLEASGQDTTYLTDREYERMSTRSGE